MAGDTNESEKSFNGVFSFACWDLRRAASTSRKDRGLGFLGGDAVPLSSSNERFCPEDDVPFVSENPFASVFFGDGV